MSVSVVLWIALGLLAFGCLFYVLVSYAMAFLGRGRPSPRARLARAMLAELGTTLILLPLWPFWWLIGSSYAATVEGVGKARGGRHPVILLHGFAMNRTNWVWVGSRLAAHGIGPLYATSYFSPQAVSRSALHLKHFIERVVAREDAERVDIVAHSLGGIVARFYIERLGGARRVGRLVTIGSPHRGTAHSTVFGWVGSAREMAPGSPFLDDLGTPSPGVAYTSIWSRADAVVVPPESSSIEPAGEDRVFDDLGHLSLLLSPRVLGCVAERLNQ